MKVASIAIALLSFSARAYAGKPSTAAAAKAASAWQQSLYGKDDAKLLGAMAFPFVSVAYQGGEVRCEDATIADAAGMAGDDGRLECIRSNVPHDGTPVALTAKAEKALGRSLAAHRKEIDAAGKRATLVLIQQMKCGKDAVYTDVVIAVRDEHGAAKVAGVWSQTGTCDDK